MMATLFSIAHLGYPTTTFKAPMIYNPYFRKAGINAAVMTMGVKSEDYTDVLRALFKLTNIRGALVTMPHKVTTVELLDDVTTAVRVSGSCNAILKEARRFFAWQYVRWRRICPSSKAQGLCPNR